MKGNRSDVQIEDMGASSDGHVVRAHKPPSKVQHLLQLRLARALFLSPSSPLSSIN